MFPPLASLAEGAPQVGSGLYPLVILLLVVGWTVFLACAGMRLVQAWREGFIPGDGSGRLKEVAALVLALAVAGVVAVWLAPRPPVLSTYTGLMHVDSAQDVSALEWQGGFPADYPLATPVFASFVMATGVEGPQAYGVASMLLVLLGVVGTFLLAGALLRSLLSATVAALVAGALPLVVLLAFGDSLGVGLLALSPWCVLFFLERLSDTPQKSSSAMVYAGCVSSLALVCQTRPEALAFPGVLLLVTVLLPGTRGIRGALRRVVPVLAAALAAMLPHVVQFVGVFISSGRLWNDVRYHVLVPAVILGMATILAAAQTAVESQRAVAAWLDRRLLPLACALLAAYCAAGLAIWGPNFLFPGGVCYGMDCAATTLRTVHVWHLNPELVPLPLVGFLIAGMLTAPTLGRGRLGAFLVLWAGLVLAGASLKQTGELPFEGARTQVAATVPLALLAAMGAQRLVRSVQPGWRRWGLLVAVVVPFYPATLVPLISFNYSQQQEFGVLSQCAKAIPDGSLLYAPDDMIQGVHVGGGNPIAVDLYTLHRTEDLVDVLGPPETEFHSRRASGMWTDRETFGPEPVYFLRTLGCYRGAEGHMNPSCQRVFDNLDVEALCEGTVEHRPYSSDFFERLRIRSDRATVGVYRIVGPNTGLYQSRVD